MINGDSELQAGEVAMRDLEIDFVHSALILSNKTGARALKPCIRKALNVFPSPVPP